MTPAQNTKTIPEEPLYALKSILEPLKLSDLFPRLLPLEVELGSGDGSFLRDYAVAHPERNFIGVERLLGRIRKLARKANRAGLCNLRGIRIESAYFLEYLLPPNSAQALHIYFPDPWPKRKHRRNRLINERFPKLAQKALAEKGRVYLRTDDHDYFQQMLTVFQPFNGFRPVASPDELCQWTTDFERGFQSRGVETLRAAYELV